MQKALVDKLHSTIDTDSSLRSEFKKHLSSSEIYKFLSDIVETSQNILLIADNTIAEIIEINETYTDTWGRMVRFVQITKHSDGDNVVYCISPDLEVLPYAQGEYTTTTEKEGNGGSTYTEQFHLDNVSQMVKDIDAKIKEVALRIDENLVFNPQKYYISIKANKNIVFMEIRKKKIRFIPLLPEDTIRNIAKKHNVISLSEPVQRFYNSPCASVDIDSVSDFDEIQNLILALTKGVRESS